MTAEEIRKQKGFGFAEGDADLRIGNILIEIAAQLAELNDRLTNKRAAEPKKKGKK